MLAPPERTHVRSSGDDGGISWMHSEHDNFPACSPQLQRGEAGQRQHHRDDPEPDHDLRFGPAQLLEMVMNGRHPEDALAAQLERTHLQNHGKRLDDENSADKKEQDFLLDDDGDCAQSSAQRQGTDITHENFRGVRVVPEKTERCADQRATENGEFTDARNRLIRQLDAFHGDQYFAGIFDHKEKRSVFKEKGPGKLDLLDSVVPDSNG